MPRRSLLPALLLLGLLLPAGAAAQNLESKVTDPVPLVELVHDSGAGRLYTLSPHEAIVADRDHGFALQPRRTGYIRRQAFDGSMPLYRLQRVGSAARLVTPSTSERDALVRSGRFRLEGVLGHIAGAAGPGLEPLWRVSNGREWRLVFERDRGALVRQGYRIDGRVGFAYRRYIRAGALYFGTFDDEARNIIAGTLRVYGRANDWWGGVRDFRSNPAARGPWANEDFSHLEPAIGFYDDAEVATAQRHIVQAASAGLDHFAFYWYWDGDAGRETLGKGLASFLTAPNRGALDFGLTVCAHEWGDGRLRIPVAQYGTVADHLVSRYLAQPDYVRANDGRRILWLCDTRGLGSGSAADVRAFVDTVRARARARLEEPVLVLGHQDLGLNAAATGIDGQYCAAPHGSTNGTYAAYVAGQRASFARTPGLFERCVMSDFDERPRYRIAIPDPADIRYFRDQTKERFAQAAANVREDVAASTRPPIVDDLALVYAWNEWHEGGVVEPSAAEGCAYLDILRRQWQLHGGSGCVAVPPPTWRALSR